MAERTVLVDDLDGTEAAHRVRIGLNGEWRRLDLSNKNHDALLKALRKFWDKAAPPKSPVSTSNGSKGGRAKGGTKAGGRKQARRYDREMFREWAAEKGIPLGKGRPAYSLLDEFESDVANGWQPQAA